MIQKLLVTHTSPDLDAVSSLWLFKRFDEQHFGDAKLGFVPAGSSMDDEESEYLGFMRHQVVHVDTGQGEFDHHTEERGKQRICAASLVLDYLIEVHPELDDDLALKRLVDHVTEIDHFGEFYWPEPNSDKYLFELHEILSALKTIGKTDEEVVDFAMDALDAVYVLFKARVTAEVDLKEGTRFKCRWGKAIGFNTPNDEVVKFAQKAGYDVVIRKDPEFGHIRIKAAPDKGIDLTNIYEIIIGRDTEATWYLHPSKAMLLNGSRKNQNQVPSDLSLQEVIEIFKSEKKQQSSKDDNK